MHVQLGYTRLRRGVPFFAALPGVYHGPYSRPRASRRCWRIASLLGAWALLGAGPAWASGRAPYFSKLTGTGQSPAEERADAVAARLPSGQVLIAGGDAEYHCGSSAEPGFNPGTSAELFNPATHTFAVLTGSGQTPTVARQGAIAAALPSGAVLIAGGACTQVREAPEYLSSAELFDPQTDTFSKLTGSGRSLTEARYRAVAATLPSGQVLIAGGVNESSENLSSAELFNPATDNFTKLTGPSRSLKQARVGAIAAQLPSGKVLIAGGYNESSEFSSAELFNPSTDTFTALAGHRHSLTEPRRNAIAATLSNGKVLIAGGYSESKFALSSAELFNPATDTFTKLEASEWSLIDERSLTEPRDRAVAATLRSGQVLIVGGTGEGNATSSSAELFVPQLIPKLDEKVPTRARLGEAREIDAYSSSKRFPRLSSATPAVCTLSASESQTKQPPGHSVAVAHFKASGICTIVARVKASGEYEAAEATASIAVRRKSARKRIPPRNGLQQLRAGLEAASERRMGRCARCCNWDAPPESTRVD